MVFFFSWLAEKVMDKFWHDISGKLLLRWRFLETCQRISHAVVYTCMYLYLEYACMHSSVNICVTDGSYYNQFV
jgi:hypothetical protein